jgi:hypothetical protein
VVLGKIPPLFDSYGELFAACGNLLIESGVLVVLMQLLTNRGKMQIYPCNRPWRPIGL